MVHGKTTRETANLLWRYRPCRERLFTIYRVIKFPKIAARVWASQKGDTEQRARKIRAQIAKVSRNKKKNRSDGNNRKLRKDWLARPMLSGSKSKRESRRSKRLVKLRRLPAFGIPVITAQEVSEAEIRKALRRAQEAE